MKTQYSQVLLVDSGGFFPELDDYEDDAWFLMDAMKLLGTDAAGVSEKELRYGRGFLLANYKRTQLPLVCANLWDKETKKTLVAPYVIKKVGSVTVGIFGLTSDKVDLGPARDSVTVEDPTAAGKRTVDELRKKGATVVVLLSELGKVESEDFVTAVDGIDAVICGRNVPLLQKGRMVKNTVACYGGEQGQYIGQTVITLDAQRKMTTGDNDTYILGPEVGEKPEVLALVKSFEDSFNDKLRKIEKERAAKAEMSRMNGGNGASEQAVDHYLGAEFCARCHQAEYDQWKTTKHSKAWQTLVDVKKDAMAECIQCHVTGYKQPGGFQTADDVARLSNVQCENCHGMGTQHEAYPTTARRITAATCEKCHTVSNSPTFNFAIYEPHILHHPPATMPPLPPNPMDKMMGTESGAKH
ncbi:MAG TPA: multiheme c-type cytochrome [Candidatus Acidoferrales bacterium]|nr:multiheme c-type cytochrome [Candidatus Acidoferrales bacterium]